MYFACLTQQLYFSFNMKKFQGYVNNSRIQLTISLLAVSGRCSLGNKLAYKIINIMSELNSIQESISIWLKWKTRFFHSWQNFFLEILTSFTIVNNSNDKLLSNQNWLNVQIFYFWNWSLEIFIYYIDAIRR